MTFLSGLFLIALPLIAVPVAIHLYRGRQRDVIPWGAMRFLTQAVTKGRSLQRLEELLLLLLRVATIVVLILALAQPMVRSSWWGETGDREIVLVLDNSLSMGREIDGVSAGNLMFERARDIVDQLTTADEVHLLLASESGQWLTAEAIVATGSGKSQIASLLENVVPTRGRADLLDCLLSAVNMDDSDNPSSRRIVVLTDQQAQSWQLEATGAWQKLGKAREKSSIPMTIEVVDCSLGEEEVDNLAVMRLESSHQLAQPKQRVTFTAQIANTGTLRSEATTVEWIVDDKVFATSKLPSLEPGETRSVSTKLRRKKAGCVAITCRIDGDDQIALDQYESRVLEIADQVPILFVPDRKKDEATVSANELFTAALGFRGDQPGAWHSVYRPELVTPDKLSDVSFSTYHAVVIADLTEMDDELYERLQDYVRAGGGLWVALGGQVNRNRFNRQWVDEGNGLCPLAIDALQSIDNSDQPGGMIHPPESDHPATAQLANTTQLDIDEARLTDYWKFRLQNNLGREGSVLLESGDGSPLVVEKYVGQGRVLVQAFPLGLEWSNLPRLKSYVVLVLDWLDYLTVPAKARYNLEPGNAIALTVPPEFEMSSATIQTPGGQSIKLLSHDTDDSVTLRYLQTQTPGLYQIEFRGGGSEQVIMPFYVSRDASESHIEPLSDEQQAQLASAAQLQFPNETTPETKAVEAESSRPEPIWGLLLLLLVGLLIAELLLSTWLSRQRSGMAVSTS